MRTPLVPIFVVAVADDLAAAAAARTAAGDRLGCDSLPLELLTDLARQRASEKALS